MRKDKNRRKFKVQLHLARLYGVETKRLKEQVRRNINRFPEDFLFELTKEEFSRSQFAILNIKRGQNLKYAFFEVKRIRERKKELNVPLKIFRL